MTEKYNTELCKLNHHEKVPKLSKQNKKHIYSEKLRFVSPLPPCSALEEKGRGLGCWSCRESFFNFLCCSILQSSLTCWIRIAIWCRTSIAVLLYDCIILPTVSSSGLRASAKCLSCGESLASAQSHASWAKLVIPVSHTWGGWEQLQPVLGIWIKEQLFNVFIKRTYKELSNCLMMIFFGYYLYLSVI